MSDVGPGEALADGTATGDAHGATDTTPLGQPPLDLQQLALLFAAQQQFQQPPPPTHRVGPVSIFGAASPFGSFGAAGAIRVAPNASFGGDGVGGLGRGGPGYGEGGGSFSRGFASPVAPPPAPRTVTFGGAPAGGDALGNDALLRQLLARITALESSREPASVDGGGGRTSPTPSMASQASTPSATSDHTASLDLALGLPDEELQHAADKHLSRKWAKLLSSAKLTLDQKSTAAALNVILCLGRSHRHLAYVLDQLLASGVGHDDARRVADEALAVAVEAERELASILAHFSVLCSKTMGPHAGIIREAARIAREAELGDRASLDGMCVPDRHVSEILSNAFKKLSEQAIKDMYTKDKSPKKASSSTLDEEPAGADLRKELEVTKKKLQQANDKLAGLGRQAPRKADAPGTKVTKRADDKAKPSKDKVPVPSSEGAGP
jgi:hypothetical protein